MDKLKNLINSGVVLKYLYLFSFVLEVILVLVIVGENKYLFSQIKSGWLPIAVINGFIGIGLKIQIRSNNETDRRNKPRRNKN